MKRVLEDALLANDLDCKTLALKNIGAFSPMSPSLVASDDPRLSDPRVLVDGSVTNYSVNPVAGIEQSKLLLNEEIPSGWLGNTQGEAAKGNLVQFTSGKDAPSGYAGLDVNGKVAIGELPVVGPGTGTVNKVSLSLPIEFEVASIEITSAGSLDVVWADQPDKSWFGVYGPNLYFELVPSFKTALIPLGFVPNLNASKFTSGMFHVEQVPYAKEIGTGHAKGITPDPGDGQDGSGSDYLGRDMQWRVFHKHISYQPTAPGVNIIKNLSPSNVPDLTLSVTLQSMLAGASIFYLTTGMSTFVEVPPAYLATFAQITLSLAPGSQVRAYTAKAGYNNSQISQYTVT